MVPMGINWHKVHENKQAEQYHRPENIGAVITMVLLIIFDKIWINELKFIYNLAPHVKFIRDCLKQGDNSNVNS